MKANLAPARSMSSANWLSRGFGGPPLLVSTFVPETFPAVVRVLNPLRGAAGRKISWAAAAQECGIALDTNPVGESLCLDYEAKTGEKLSVDFGTVDRDVASTLSEVLSLYTVSPDKCFFAVWTGYSDIRDELTRAPVVVLPPEREMFLLEGPIGAAVEPVDEQGSRRSVRWWPSDQAWCVGNDLYADSVYVAGSTKCISALVDDPRLESQVVHHFDIYPCVYAG